MTIKHTRSILHLAITGNTTLRVVLYIAKDKIDWYNENKLDELVLKELYPVILNHILQDHGSLSNKKPTKDTEASHSIHMDGFRIIYKFTSHNMQQKLLKKTKSFCFLADDGQDDQKPTTKTSYKSLKIYPEQLLVSVDDELLIGTSNNTLESYFTSVP